MNFRRYDCATVREMLPLHVGGDLEERHTASVDDHLHACLNCFREFRELATARGRLTALAEEPLPDGILAGFTEEVMARVRLGEPGPAAEAPRAPATVLPLRRVLAVAAVIVAAGLAVTLVIDRPAEGIDGASPSRVFAPTVAVDAGNGDFDPSRGWPAPGVGDVGGRPRSGATPAADHGGSRGRGIDARAFGLDGRMLGRMLESLGRTGPGDRLELIPRDLGAPGGQDHLHMMFVTTSELLKIKQAREMMGEQVTHEVEESSPTDHPASTSPGRP